ncbi:MAG: cysteine synthase A [Acetobacter sp.]|nr:cysteine synthase A [Acetobacter sp.]
MENRFGFVAPRGRVYDSIINTVGGTPLVALPRLTHQEKLKSRLLLKLEYFNPLSSVKDRIGVAMVLDAENKGLITPEKTLLVEPTSGNTGISLAFVAAARGYRLTVVMPKGASIERQRMVKLLGGHLELTPPELGMKGAIARANEILAENPKAWMPSQFTNLTNPEVHVATTAEEIWTDTNGEVDVVVAGVGSGGTVTGIAHALKPRKSELRVFAVEPSDSAVLNGHEPGPHAIQGIGSGFVPEILDVSILDSVIMVPERDAIETARKCAKVDGIPIGISSGAALHAALNLAKKEEYTGKTIVAIAPSCAERYLSTSLFDGL